MQFEVINIFPTTIYVGRIENHEEYKKEFYKVYSKFDYEQVNQKTKTINTVSENQGNPLIHLEENLDPLFHGICDHVKKYLSDVLYLKDIFDVVITKSWLSRARELDHEIPWHIHTTSHISFVYYLNIPDNSQFLQFSNEHRPNSVFTSLFTEDCDGEEFNMFREYNQLTAEVFYLMPKEGNLVLFPSKLPHSTKSKSNTFEGERLAIVGDITLVLKEEYLSFSSGYIHEKYWKKYT
jgi:uncharacterized protein (TIGR02466 family)